jgi:hypothetical protein
MRPHLLTLALLATAASLGCRSPCRQLAEKLCDCEANTSLKEECLQQAQQQESSLGVPITEEEQSTCEGKLNPQDGGQPCDCRKLEAPDSAARAQAKRDCGLAR